MTARSRSLLALAATASLLGCAGAAPEAGEPAGSVQGQLAVFIADGDNGAAETRYFLERPGGAQLRLLFERQPELASGASLSVWGTPAGPDSLLVAGYHPLATSTGSVVEQRSALQAGTPLPARSFAFVLLDAGAGVNLTAAQVNQEMFDASYFAVGLGSIRRYYQEASYGLQDIAGSVVGPISFTPATSCDTAGAVALRATVDTMVGGPSDNYLWYFGSRQAGCDWAGLASVGSPASPTKDTWYNASANCVVLAQEPGHNFGMQHSSSMKCGAQTFVDAPDGTCTHSEYGDIFDPMGNGCFHMNAWQKQYQGWFGGCNSVRVSASGTFTLLPLEAKCDGIQSLQIPMPHTRTFSYTNSFTTGTTADELTYYYVELRSQGAGFDQALTPQVQVRVGGDYRPRSQIGLHTWLLDMNPSTATFNDAAMAVGQTFTDPAGGLSITATAVGAASATITITMADGSGAPVCLDGTTLTPPGPATCSGAAAAGTGGAGDASGTGGSSGATGGSPPGGSAGCGCALAEGRRGRAPWSMVVIVGAVWLARARRRRNLHSTAAWRAE